MARFSVLIPVHNGADFLAEALRSVADQSLDGVRVVVSDNASTDATAQILKEWEQRLDLRVIRRAEILPMQTNFNTLLDAVDTEFYMLLCHDDYLADADALRLAQESLDADPHIAAVYCNLVYVNAGRRVLARRVFRRSRRFSADNAGVRTILTARNQFGIPLGVRTSRLGTLRYDSRFHYAMDVDLSWALSRNQMVGHIPRALIANRYRGTNATWTLLSRARSELIGLADKYDVPMGRLDRAALFLTIHYVNIKKRLFDLYGRLLK